MRRANRGMSLIEALIALLVISIGLLGVMAMQVSGVAFNNVAATRSIAAIDAQTMMDLMRANICGVTNAGATDAPPQCDPGADNAFSYANMTSESPAPTDFTLIADPGNACRTAGSACSSQAQAAADLWLVSQLVASDLPNATVAIACNDVPCTNRSTYTVTINWTEKDEVTGDSAEVRTFSTVFLP